MTNASTRCLWMLGHPVTQTVSPGLFNQAFAAAQEKIVMLAIDVPPAQLGSALEVLRHAKNVLGCVLTIPHKLAAVRFMDHLSERSQALGLVNIVRKTQHGLEGDALDGQGFSGALKQRGINLKDRTVLILGAGGAGASSAWDALDAGASLVGLFDIDTSRLQTLAQVLGKRFGANRLQLLQCPEGDWSCVLNASPLGMRPDDPDPMPVHSLMPGAVLVDATTAEHPSRWLEQAEQRGHLVIHGAAFTCGQILAMARFLSMSVSMQDALQNK